MKIETLLKTRARRRAKRDFEFLFLMKDKDSYIFTYQKLRRERITMDVNKVSNFLPSKPNITSHSFRIGYISQLPEAISFAIGYFICGRTPKIF